MNRPYIICHMVVSLDGKVTGEFLNHSTCARATDLYYDINRTLPSNGFICGRVTKESSFTGGWYPDLSAYAPVDHKADFVPEQLSGFYAVAFDTCGRLGWKHNRIVDDDPGYGNAQIIEILSENVDARYLGYLQSMQIPYLFAGKETIDVTVALFKLKALFDIQTLLLEGGSIINGAFQKAGVIDELSLVVAPLTADACDKPLFMDGELREHCLASVESKDGILVLKYKKA